MKYTTARLQRYHRHASDNFVKLNFRNMFSEKDLLCGLILIHVNLFME